MTAWASAPKASMGGTCAVREELGKHQKPRSCRAQELARSSAQENEWWEKGHLRDPVRIGLRSSRTSTTSGDTLRGPPIFRKRGIQRILE